MASALWADAVSWSPPVSPAPANPPLSSQAEYVRESLWYPACDALPSWVWEQISNLHAHQRRRRLQEMIRAAEVPYAAWPSMPPPAPAVDCSREVAAVRAFFWNQGYNDLPLDVWEAAAELTGYKRRAFLHRSLVEHSGGKITVKQTNKSHGDETDDEYAAVEARVQADERDAREEEQTSQSDSKSFTMHARAYQPVTVPPRLQAAFDIVQAWLERERVVLPQPLVVAFLQRLPFPGEELAPNNMERRGVMIDKMHREDTTQETHHVAYLHYLRIRTVVLKEFVRLIREHPMYRFKMAWWEDVLNRLVAKLFAYAGEYVVVAYPGQTARSEWLRYVAGYVKQFWGVWLSVAEYRCWRQGDVAEFRRTFDHFGEQGLIYGDVSEMSMFALLGSETLATCSVLGKAPLFTLDPRLNPTGNNFQQDQKLSLSIVFNALPRFEHRNSSRFYVQLDNLLPRIFGVDVKVEVVNGAFYSTLLPSAVPVPVSSDPAVPVPVGADPTATLELQGPLRNDVIVSQSHFVNTVFAKLGWFAAVDGTPLNKLRSGTIVDVEWTDPPRRSKYIYLQCGGHGGDDETKRIQSDKLAAAVAIARDLLILEGIPTDDTMDAAIDALAASPPNRKARKLMYHLSHLKVLHGSNIDAVRAKCKEMRDWVGLGWDSESCLSGVKQILEGYNAPRFGMCRCDGEGKRVWITTTVGHAQGKGFWDVTPTSVLVKDASDRLIREIPLDEALNRVHLVPWVELNVWQKRLQLDDIPKPQKLPHFTFRPNATPTGYWLFGNELTKNGTIKIPWNLLRFKYLHSPDKADYDSRAATMRANKAVGTKKGKSSGVRAAKLRARKDASESSGSNSSAESSEPELGSDAIASSFGDDEAYV